MDRVGNFLTSIRNAYLAHKDEALVPRTNQTLAIAQILVKEKYLDSVAEETTESGRQLLRLKLRYDKRDAAVLRIRRVSKPGRRLYAPATNLPRPKAGFGTMIVSTSQGIMTDRDARAKGVGGEIMAELIRGAY